MTQSPVKVLIVEDEPLIRKVYKDYLTKMGLEVYEASNGQVGLSQAIEHKPDIILLDILMPIMDGIEMLKRLRKDAWGKNAKILILTNLSREEHEMIAAEQNVFDYFVKADHSLEDVYDRIKLMLKFS